MEKYSSDIAIFLVECLATFVVGILFVLPGNNDLYGLETLRVPVGILFITYGALAFFFILKNDKNRKQIFKATALISGLIIFMWSLWKYWPAYLLLGPVAFCVVGALALFFKYSVKEEKNG